MTDAVIPLPPQLRVMSAPVDARAPGDVAPVLVDNCGQAYRLADLMTRPSPAKLAAVEASRAAIRTGSVGRGGAAVAGVGEGDRGGVLRLANPILPTPLRSIAV